MSELSNKERQCLAMLCEMKLTETRLAGTATKYTRMWESTDPAIYQRWETMAVIDALNEVGALVSETKVPNTLNEDAAVKFARTWLLATGSLTLEQVDKYAKPLARDIIKAALS